jgi:GntR family transcriptional regulator/MocR family aminotransferase
LKVCVCGEDPLLAIMLDRCTDDKRSASNHALRGELPMNRLGESTLGHIQRPHDSHGDPLFEIHIDKATKSSRDSAASIHRQLKSAIFEGRLLAGTRLPSPRRSSIIFGISRNTAARVYERLRVEGYVVIRHGSGSYVADRVPKSLSPANPLRPASADHHLNGFWLRPDITAAMSFWQDCGNPSSGQRETQAIDMRPAIVDSRLFPFEIFRRVNARQLRLLERKPASYKSAQGNQGSFQLRRSILKHIAVTRAVICQPKDILVTSGAQQAFDLLARVLVTPGKTVVAIEDPGYPPMRVGFAAAGAKLISVGVDNEGLIVDHLPRDANVICVTPSHQFPLGIAMSIRRRKALIEFARQQHAVVIEDDYDGEFRLVNNSLEALRGGDADDVVFYVGTFSKCMLPALRLGFIVAPEWAMPNLVAAKNCADWHSATPVQSAVAEFIAGGHLARHVTKMRVIYAQRRESLLKCLEMEVGKWLQPIPSHYGLHITAAARSSVNLEGITQALLRRNLKIHTLSRYFVGQQSWKGLIFGYGTVDVPAIRKGVSLIRAALEK